MKKGNVCKADAIDSSDTSSSCGIITESSCGGNSKYIFRHVICVANS